MRAAAWSSPCSAGATTSTGPAGGSPATRPSPASASARAPTRPPRTEIPDGRMIRSPINKRRAAYETLLSAGKQGLIVFIDRNPYIYFDHTYNALIRAGLKKAF